MSRLPFSDAMDLVPDDLPDGAYWAMAHEMAGLDYGDGFDEIFPAQERSKAAPSSRRQKKTARMERPRSPDKPFRCGTCGNDFATKGAKKRHRLDVHRSSPPVGEG